MRLLSLISGGIDSPVASYVMAERGAEIVLLHMDNRPYSDDLSLRR
jgi:thiamine biosynthesis protein ThiI